MCVGSNNGFVRGRLLIAIGCNCHCVWCFDILEWKAGLFSCSSDEIHHYGKFIQ